MPELGEIRHGKDIGYKANNRTQYTWIACEVCGKIRWVAMAHGKPISTRCKSCAIKSIETRAKMSASHIGQCNRKWKGGRCKTAEGYIHVYVQPNDFFAPMATHRNYILEHRLVIAKKLGRCLQSWEIVHHKGIRYKGIENRSDNLEDNLELKSDIGHKQLTLLEKRITVLEKRITQLEAENVLLRSGFVLV